MYYCVCCSDEVQAPRWKLGLHTCLLCGEKRARQRRHTIVPMAKSNYQPIVDLDILKQLNKYSKA